MADEKKQKSKPEGEKKAAARSSPRPRPARLQEVLGRGVPALKKQFGYKNPMQVPKLQKIVVNMGLGKPP
jgi:large subunit ribosomal protein L5